MTSLIPDHSPKREVAQRFGAELTKAMKARGVGQLLAQLAQAVGGARPPELTAEAEKVRAAWERTLEEEADVQADVLVGTLEPYQTEVEHHFSVEGQSRFRGLMAAYLKVTTRLRYAGSGLRDRLPFAGLKGKLLGQVDTPVEWNLGAFVQECARTAGERVLDQRTTALINRLLVEADAKGFPPLPRSASIMFHPKAPFPAV